MFSGVLQKMTSIHDDPVRYILDFESNFMLMNQAINKEMHIQKRDIAAYHVMVILRFLQMVFVKSVFLSHPSLVIGS